MYRMMASDYNRSPHRRTSGMIMIKEAIRISERVCSAERSSGLAELLRARKAR